MRLSRLPLVLVAAGALASPAWADAPDVPGDIAVPAGNKPFLDAHAVGVQIYSCDGNTCKESKVVGKRDAGVKVDATAIDWLRLSAVSTTPGRLGRTTYIQRIHTAGGLTPAAADCNAATTGTTREVPYTADYVFWKADDGEDD